MKLTFTHTSYTSYISFSTDFNIRNIEVNSGDGWRKRKIVNGGIYLRSDITHELRIPKDEIKQSFTASDYNH